MKLYRNGLFDKFEDVLSFIQLRKSDIDSGLNIEKYKTTINKKNK